MRFPNDEPEDYPLSATGSWRPATGGPDLRGDRRAILSRLPEVVATGGPDLRGDRRGSDRVD